MISSNQKQKRITVSEMAPHVHSFKYGENKVDKLYQWISDWIKNKLKSGDIRPYDFLPSKGDLAFHIGVSKGTIQNVFRLLEDSGLVESKQRIGTYIKDNNSSNIDKHTSKREIAAQKIMEYAKNCNYKKGDILPTARTMSNYLNMSFATIRMAICHLVLKEIIIKKNNNFVINTLDFSIEDIKQKTLVEKISKKIYKYIKENLKAGEKLPSNIDLAKKYNVSPKTIHDSIKLLMIDDIVNTRRGKYGTIVTGNNNSKMYNYEQVEIKIRHYISHNSQIGEKLPSIRDFAKLMEVSTKTIKTALDNLAEEGYITFARGRYGGTFVLEIPQNAGESYTWLAINPNYISAIEN